MSIPWEQVITAMGQQKVDEVRQWNEENKPIMEIKGKDALDDECTAGVFLVNGKYYWGYASKIREDGTGFYDPYAMLWVPDKVVDAILEDQNRAVAK